MNTDHARQCAAEIWCEFGWLTEQEAADIIQSHIAAAVEEATRELRAEVQRLKGE